MANAIQTENAIYGGAGPTWPLYAQRANLDARVIAGYTDKTSYNPGDTVTFFVSVQSAPITWTLTIYRVGYYYGARGRLVATQSGITGQAQGYYDGSVMQNCPTAVTDASTHLLDVNWASSATWAIPANACTGVYIAQFTDTNGHYSYAAFVVKQATLGADYAYIRPTTTDQAYNTYGGYSLYTDPSVGTKVSYNRPDYNTDFDDCLSKFWNFELAGLLWLEKSGYNIGYLTMDDIQANGVGILDNYKAVLFAGHCEYWSYETRAAVESALAHGVGLGFLGANACYWQSRYETDHNSIANRTLVCYKVGYWLDNLSLDPFYGVDNLRVTSQWADLALNRPENALVGLAYESYTNGANAAFVLDTAADTRFLGGTGLSAGATAAYDTIGYEFDKATGDATQPANLHIIGTSPILNVNGQSDHSNCAYYYAPSGALVFASGSHSFMNACDPYRFSTPTSGEYSAPGVQALMANVMAGLLTGKTATNALSGYRS